MGLFIQLWLSTGNSFKSFGKAFVTLMVSKLSTGNSFKSFGKAFVTLMVSKTERTNVLLI